MRESLKFCYKGDRKYIHGTDIFNAIYSFYQNSTGSQPDNIEMGIHHIIRNNLTLVIQEDLLPSEKVAVNFIVSDNGLLKRIMLIENGEFVDCQYDYPEYSIVKSASINEKEKTISLIDYHDFTFIEKAVALNKELLTAVFPNAEGKWYFTKIKLFQFDLNQQSPQNLVVRFKKNLNFKLTQSEILVADKFVGNIYFSLV